MRARFALQVSVAFGIAAFVVACGSSSPTVGSAPKGATPTTAPYSVALACDEPIAADYKPDQAQPDRQFQYRSDDHITAIAYDSSGNLYIGVSTSRGSWVDEYSPGRTQVSRHITDGIDEPAAIVADTRGNLYVANLGNDSTKADVVRYAPESTSPDLKLDDFDRPLALVFLKYLWVADYGRNVVSAFENEKRKYDIKQDIRAPSALSEVGGNLYILNNKPGRGQTNYVSEWGIGPVGQGPPIFARTIGVRRGFNLVKAIATDPRGNVYLGEWTADGSKYAVDVYDGDGQWRFTITCCVTEPAALVASPSSWYVAEGTSGGETYRYERTTLKGTLDEPTHCSTPRMLAIMPPST